MQASRIGHGYDVHPLTEGHPLILGGVAIPHTHGLVGHSDADVLIHAICDALLGAAALGDIGNHFPDTNPEYKNVDSRKLLRAVSRKLSGTGYYIGNIDATLVIQKPKIQPYFAQMRENIADDLQLEIDAVSVKATTTEGLGFTGTGAGIAAHAVVLIERL